MHIVQRPTSKHGPASKEPITPYYLVIHDTQGSHPGDLNWLLNPDAEVSVHYLVAPNGAIYQMVQDDKRAWHAGRSSWVGYSGMNNFSIGIEVSHVSATGKLYPTAQLKSLDELIWMLHSKHHFKGARPIGHREIAPGRKSDPDLNLENYTWQKVESRLYPEGVDMSGEHDLLVAIAQKLDRLQQDVDKSQRASSYREAIMIALTSGDEERAKTLAEAAAVDGIVTGYHGV